MLSASQDAALRLYVAREVQVERPQFSKIGSKINCVDATAFLIRKNSSVAMSKDTPHRRVTPLHF